MRNKFSTYISSHGLWPVLDVLLFAVITAGFHKLWWSFNAHFASGDVFRSVTGFLAAAVFDSSAWIDAHILNMDIIKQAENIIHFNANHRAIQINEGCSGFKQMWQVLILFLIFPGPLKHKAWYIPLGILAMFLINIIRIVGLSVVMIHWPQQWDFIHLWVFRPLYYVVIFLMWVWWIERFGGIRRWMGK
jgi:exosortase/archaeosortase family protein